MPRISRAGREIRISVGCGLGREEHELEYTGGKT